MAKRKKSQVKKSVAVVIGAACLSSVWWLDKERKQLTESEVGVQFSDVINRGFEAFSSNDLYNAELIFASFFDKKGNDLNAFSKLNPYQQQKTRSLYGEVLFRKSNFQKAEVILLPIFKDDSSIRVFLDSEAPYKNLLATYSSLLQANDNQQELLKICNIFFDKNGNASELLKRFKDPVILRWIAGKIFFHQNEHKKVAGILKPLFDDSELLTKLSIKQQAFARLYYGHSLICENKEDDAQTILAAFFDENCKPTKLFEILNQENQNNCRMHYAQLLLTAGNFEKISELLKVFFNDTGELLPQFKNLSFQDILHDIYGQSLIKQRKFWEANRVVSWFFKPENKQFIKNLTEEELETLKVLLESIARINVNSW